MTNLKSNTSERGYYLLLFCITIVFVILCCPAVSPLIERHTIDSSVFIAMGKMFLDGMIPYVDFFDHKGPMLILIEAIGQLILPYRAGAFIIVTLNWLLVVLVADRILRMFFSNKQIILSVIMFLFLFLTRTFEKGNSVEEFGLVPALIALYIGLKYLFTDKDNKKITRFQGFILGFLFSIYAWMRVNDGGALCGITIFLFISSIVEKDYKSTLNLVLYFIIGLVPLSAMFLCYFYSHNALYEMLYATFLFNLQYSGYGGVNYNNLWLNLVVFLLIGIGTYLSYKKEKNKQIVLFSVCILLLSVFTINIGRGSKHYFTNYAPTIVYSFILIYKYLDNSKLTKRISGFIILLFAITVSIMGGLLLKDSAKRNQGVTNYKEKANELLQKIPAEDLSQVYCYAVESQFYTIMQLNTNYKYFVFQEWHSLHDPQIMENIKALVSSPDGPLWILMQKSEVKRDGYNVGLKSIIDKRYALYGENDMFVLYSLNK